MLNLAPGTKVYMATELVDMRRGHDGLCALVESEFQLDPYSGHVFVFLGRRRDRAKVLFWDRGGFVLYYKRLAKGRFATPRFKLTERLVVLDGTELAMLLGGFELAGARRSGEWRPSRSAVAA